MIGGSTQFPVFTPAGRLIALVMFCLSLVAVCFIPVLAWRVESLKARVKELRGPEFVSLQGFPEHIKVRNLNWPPHGDSCPPFPRAEQ